MKYYKDSNNKIFGFETDGSQDHLKSENLMEITKAEVDVINKQKFQAQLDARDYGTKRQAAYPLIADFADAWVKQDNAALEAYRAACLAVKNQYPKE